MGLNISKHSIRTAVLFISFVIVAHVGLVYVTQVALAQSTPPPRPTPTGSDLSTPVRSTPTPIDTPISNETPVRSTPTPIDTPVSNETPVRPTPTSANVPPPPTAHPKPEGDPPEATLVATPHLLPVSGVVSRDDRRGLELLLLLAGLGIVGWGLGASVHRWRQHQRD